MKVLLSILVVWFLFGLVLYAIGVFVSLEPDVREWGVGGRSVFVATWFWIAIPCSFFSEKLK